MSEFTNKIYVASLCAAHKSENTSGNTDESFYWEHAPLLLTSTSIETASLIAKGAAFDLWKPADGWTNHSASISPVTAEFETQFAQLLEQRIITLEDDSSETQKFFKFDDDQNNSKDLLFPDISHNKH